MTYLSDRMREIDADCREQGWRRTTPREVDRDTPAIRYEIQDELGKPWAVAAMLPDDWEQR